MALSIPFTFLAAGFLAQAYARGLEHRTWLFAPGCPGRDSRNHRRSFRMGRGGWLFVRHRQSLVLRRPRYPCGTLGPCRRDADRCRGWDGCRRPIVRQTTPHRAPLHSAAASLGISVAAIFAGGLVVADYRLALALGFAPAMLLLLTSPLAHLIVVSFVAFFAFQNSADVSILKTAYVVCCLLSVIRGRLSL